MKKTFSALLIATFVAYVLYSRAFSPPEPLLSIAANRSAPTLDNGSVALNNTTVASTTPPVAVIAVNIQTPSPVNANADLQAQGTVRIVNNSNSSIELVRSTRLLSTNGKQFRLASGITVAAHGQAAVSVYADNNGTDYALAPSRFSMPGLSTDLQAKIYAVSDATFVLAKPLPATGQTVAVAPPAKTTPKPAPVPKPVPVPAPAPKPQGQYKDGTYTGPSVDAYYGNVQVAAVIQNGKLADVKILDYPQDRRTSQYINGQALPILVQEAISAQNANVDAVSGASESSPAFKQSLSAALVQAKN